MGRLYLVATPIGNLEDVTLRALRLLGESQLVLAEDTRRTRILLERHAVAARPVSLHAHNEAARCVQALAVLDAGGDVALVSDAGTPLVSDPGARLVRAALEAGHEVSPVPGPSALLAALCSAGLPSDRFSFVGFLPRRAGERDALLGELAIRPETLVFFESPRRLGATLAALGRAFGERAACVGRELTKRHEELVRGTLASLAAHFAEPPKGEVTIVVAGAGPAEPADVAGGELDGEIRAGLRAGESARDLAARLARERSVPRRAAYARVLALKGSD
jgi:16S rRNA (cytidine1402-2'-O)-methyltransferase